MNLEELIYIITDLEKQLVNFDTAGYCLDSQQFISLARYHSGSTKTYLESAEYKQARAIAEAPNKPHYG